VIVFPSDHYVSDEGHLSEAVVNAIEALDRNSDRVVLLGMAPHDEDTEYGWIVPSGRPASIQRVAAFVEKPDRFKVRDLRHQGGLLNSLILVGTARTLLNLHSFSVPELVGEFASWWNGPRTGAPVLAGLYRNLPCRDFSKEVLQRCCESLSVVRVPECGWTDLGTPERLREFQALQLSAKRGTAQCSATSNPVNREQRSSP
jgi:mannose-1-phosphate guanylyltransferase